MDVYSRPTDGTGYSSQQISPMKRKRSVSDTAEPGNPGHCSEEDAKDSKPFVDAIALDQPRISLAKGHGDHTINEPQMLPHQVKGLRFMWDRLVKPEGARGCLLAHTMGLSKTVQVISLLEAIAKKSAPPGSTVTQIPADLCESKTLILCPPGVVNNWLDELRKWVPAGLLGDFFAVSADTKERSKTVEDWATKGGVLVIGYKMFQKLLQASDETRKHLQHVPRIVVADEAHMFKNHGSNLHTAMSSFTTKARVAMTGTPLANNPEEYFSVLDWAEPGVLGTLKNFQTTFAQNIYRGNHKTSSPEQKEEAKRSLNELEEKTAHMIDRETMDGLGDKLPPKREFILYLRLDEMQRNVYQQFLTRNKDVAKNADLWDLIFNLRLVVAGLEVFWMRLREILDRGSSQSTASPSANSNVLSPATARELMMTQDAIGNSKQLSSKVTVLLVILDKAKRIHEKVLVFSQSRLVLDYLENIFQVQQRHYSRLDGTTAVKGRQSMVKSFNTGRDEVFLISTMAGGVGLNVHGANRVVIFDFKWNPVHEQQAIGRAYRIGQTKPVFVYWLIVDGTYETVLHNQAVFKTQLASRVVDRENPAALAELTRKYKAPPRIPPPVDDATAATFCGQDVVLDALLDASRRCCISRITLEEEPEAEKTCQLTQSVLTRGYVQADKIYIHIGHSREGNNPAVAFFNKIQISIKVISKGQVNSIPRKNIAFLKELECRALEVVAKYVLVRIDQVKKEMSGQGGENEREALREAEKWPESDRSYVGYLGGRGKTLPIEECFLQ